MNFLHSLLKYSTKKTCIISILSFAIILFLYFPKITQVNTPSPRYGLDFKLSYKVSKTFRWNYFCSMISGSFYLLKETIVKSKPKCNGGKLRVCWLHCPAQPGYFDCHPRRIVPDGDLRWAQFSLWWPSSQSDQAQAETAWVGGRPVLWSQQLGGQGSRSLSSSSLAHFLSEITQPAASSGLASLSSSTQLTCRLLAVALH